MTNSMPTPDWLELPDHLLQNIIHNLVCEDFVSFKSVCKTWQAVAIQVQHLHSKRLCPGLLIPSKQNRETSNFYNLFDKKLIIYDEFLLSLHHDNYCNGSCFGWLVMAQWKEKTFCVQLLNPFLSYNQIIHLPSLNSHMVVSFDGELFPLQKLVLSDNPNFAPYNFVVMAIFFNSMLVSFKPGNKAWTSIVKWGETLDDIIYFNKTKRFYVVDRKGAVLAVDTQHGSQDCDQKLIQVAPPPSIENFWKRKRYIVESSSGDLLQIHRPTDRPSTFEFHILKWDPMEKTWTEIQSLGDQMLFLGGGSSISLSASESPQCKPGCIYYVEDTINFPKVVTRDDRLDMIHNHRTYIVDSRQEINVFNLQDRTIQSTYPKLNNHEIAIYPGKYYGFF